MKAVIYLTKKEIKKAIERYVIDSCSYVPIDNIDALVTTTVEEVTIAPANNSLLATVAVNVEVEEN